MSDNGTTELREKLDALGIEHLDSDLPNNKQTRWNKRAGGWGACYVEITHNSILPADSIIDNRTLRIYDCTPEQAIAATLGDDGVARSNDGVTRYHELFGSPERAARTLEKAKGLCNWCDMETCAVEGGECRIYDYDALLEWLRGDAE